MEDSEKLPLTINETGEMEVFSGLLIFQHTKALFKPGKTPL